jgi:septum formation protein
VVTAVALRWQDDVEVALSISHVTLRRLTAREIDRYVASGEPLDKAGGYAIQGLAAAFVTRLEGSYSGVMGLPLAETAALLARIGRAVL